MLPGSNTTCPASNDMWRGRACFSRRLGFRRNTEQSPVSKTEVLLDVPCFAPHPKSVKLLGLLQKSELIPAEAGVLGM